MASPTLPGWVLLHDGRPVSYSAFNAKTHGVVQVGGGAAGASGPWIPEELGPNRLRGADAPLPRHSGDGGPARR